MLLNNFPFTDIPQNRMLYFRSNQVLQQWGKLFLYSLSPQQHVLTQYLINSLVLQYTHNAHNSLVFVGSYEHFDQGCHVSISNVQEELRLNDATQTIWGRSQRLVKRSIFAQIFKDFGYFHQSVRITKPLSPRLLWQFPKNQFNLILPCIVTSHNNNLIIYNLLKIPNIRFLLIPLHLFQHSLQPPFNILINQTLPDGLAPSSNLLQIHLIRKYPIFLRYQFEIIQIGIWSCLNEQYIRFNLITYVINLRQGYFTKVEGKHAQTNIFILFLYYATVWVL